MSPGHKRQIAELFVSGERCTARAACRHFGLHRSTFGYQAKEPDAWLAKLKSALRRMSNKHPELGYPKITRLLKKEGWKVGSRIIQKLRRELGLAVPARKPKKRRKVASTGLPTKATHRVHVWTWDFVHDTTMRGGKLRMLNVLDEHTRECLCIHVDRRINARKVHQIISNLIDVHGSSGAYSQRQWL
jgi:putative transposase